MIAETEPTWRFEENIANCKKDHFCIGLATSITPQESPYVYVGKIMAVDVQEKTFKMKPYQCTVDPWTPECLDVAVSWHHHGRAVPITHPHHSVMQYVKKLNKGNKLPKAALDACKLRSIVWPSSN
jgi:hypothetical protein